MSPLITVSGLNHFFGAKQALKEVSFDIQAGQPVALVGPNGAGKTTLFSILCGYLQASSGQVEILGHKVGSAALFGQLAALPQDAVLDPRFSIAHQLSFYGRLQGLSAKESKTEALRTLELVGLSEALNEKPAALSHGMRKRVSIAQTLIGSPKIVMLDEATAGLDPLHAREIRQLVADLSQDITFILSSHDLTELERLCQQVLYLELGQMHQHQTLASDATQGFLTLSMSQKQPELIVSLEAMPEVHSVTMPQDREYLIRLAPNVLCHEADIKILEVCHQNQWRYRSLVNGKTLENQLFE